MWGCFLMSGVKILHFLKDWWKSIPIHQNYIMALKWGVDPWGGGGGKYIVLPPPIILTTWKINNNARIGLKSTCQALQNH